MTDEQTAQEQQEQQVTPEQRLATMTEQYLKKVDDLCYRILETAKIKAEADATNAGHEAMGLWQQHSKEICFVAGMVTMLVVVLISTTVARF